MYKKILALAAMLLSLLAPLTASAGPATDLVKTKQTKLFELVSKPKTDEQQQQLRALFDEMLAYDAFAKGSLGDKWNELSDAQKKQFSDLLTELVRGNYKKNLKKMLDYAINYNGEETEDGKTVVKTVAKHKSDSREPEIEINFKLDSVNGKLKVLDIVTERASLVKTYRSQFLKILKEKGFDALIAKMQKKLDKQNKKDG
jgi:phospholipid transport system substrate-binding protein